ncbi:MAG: hypothetical protein KGI08_09390 [Thaumarchaeota archaeon]|nr:hypothetical protein [Nitrososphaerota archaeon]
MNFQIEYMDIDLMDEIANTQREYVKARLKAEKTRDPEAVKRIKQAQKLLEKAEYEADKTMDSKLKKKSDELFRKLQIM